MSALGQKQTYAVQEGMSASPPKADICSALAHVCFGPEADISHHTPISSRRHIQVEVLLPNYLFRSSRRAAALLSPLRPWSAHVVSFWPVRDEYGHEHSSNQSRPRTVARPIRYFSFEPHFETLILSMSDLAYHSPAVSLLFNAFIALDTQVAVFVVTKSPTANKTYV